MSKKLFFIASIVLLLGLISQAEDIQWVGGGADNLWSTPENWDLVRVPTLDDEVRIDVPAAAAPNGPVIQDGIDAKAKGIFTEAAGEPMLTITGGTLEVAEWIWWGDGADSFATLDMSGGTVSVTDEFELGWGGGAGILTITGGTISAGEAVIPTGSGAFGQLNLNGGTYNVTKPGGLEVNATGLVDITEGTLVLEGDDTAKVNDLIAAGLITAYGGAGQIEVDFDISNPGKTTVTAVAATIEKTVLFAEDFEGLVLGPNIDEELAGDAVWTDTPPEGWIVDESGIPGINMDATDGVTEWAGWAFTDKAWWTQAAEDQRRSEFTLGQGTVAVADPDEWDDAERLPIPISADPYDTWLTTPAIKIGGVEAGTLELKFDSSWRPEFDDNYHQTASIIASFDGGEPIEVLRWESDSGSPNFKDDNSTNETIVVDLQNPEGAKKVVLTFGLFDAGNDWWWAIDNIEVRGVVLYQEPVDPGINGLLACYPLDGNADDSSGNGIHGTIYNADTGGLGEGGSVWVDDPERGTVISFNGTASGAYVRAGEIPQMTLTNDFTWSFWAKQKAENTANNDIILGNRMDENAVDFVPRQFIKFTPTKFEWHMNGNGDDNMDYDDIPADVWLHHAVVKTGDQLTYYRNGVESSLGTITQPLDFPQPLFFGGDNEGAEGENWNGLMSDVCIYDRALSEAEIRYLAGERAIPVDPGTNGLVAYYAFENDATDSSGNELHGTLVGDAGFAEGPDGYGMALNLDGDGDYVDCGTSPLLDITEEISFAFWIKAVALDKSWNTVLSRGDDSWRSSRAGTNNFMEAAVGGTSGNYLYGVTPVDDGMWHHVGAVYDGETFSLYVDGELDGSEESTGNITASSYPLYIGNNSQNTDREWTGLIDEVIIYDRALSVGEVRYLAGFRSAVETDPSLVIYYSFDEVGDIVADQSGKGHDGVVVGDVTAEANGMYGGAANLANTGYLDLDGANFPAEDIPTSGFTLAAWTNIDGTSNQNAIFNARASDSTWLIHPEIRVGDGDYRFTVRKYGGVTIGNINGGTPGYKQPEGTPVPNEWVHVAMTFSRVDAQVILYVNGQVVAEAAISEDADMAGDWGLGARVGYNIDDARHYTGLMDEFRMYTRALSQDEILGIMQGP